MTDHNWTAISMVALGALETHGPLGFSGSAPVVLEILHSFLEARARIGKDLLICEPYPLRRHHGTMKHVLVLDVDHVTLLLFSIADDDNVVVGKFFLILCQVDGKLGDVLIRVSLLPTSLLQLLTDLFVKGAPALLGIRGSTQNYFG